MDELTTVLVGALVTVATFYVNKLVAPILDGGLRTAVKALVTLAVSFGLACLQLILLGTFTWAGLWANLPVVVAAAMTFYGLIIKPATASK